MGAYSFKVGGLHCGGCVNSVQSILRALPGVRSANVDLDTARAEIDATETFDASAAIAAVTKAGFVLNPV